MRYMLDTNIASCVIKDNFPQVHKHLMHRPMHEVCISAVTEAELLLGTIKKSDNVDLKNIVHEFLLRVDILSWDSAAAYQYANLRAMLEKSGKPIGNMDMMIAAHALSIDATLVSNDKVFQYVLHYKKNFKVKDWTKP